MTLGYSGEVKKKMEIFPFHKIMIFYPILTFVPSKKRIFSEFCDRNNLKFIVCLFPTKNEGRSIYDIFFENPFLAPKKVYFWRVNRQTINFKLSFSKSSEESCFLTVQALKSDKNS